MRICTGILLALIAALAQAREPVVGLPCENCEAVFEGMPQKLGSRARIAGANEPGQPMLVTGVVRNALGKAVGGVVVYAYQTDSKGVYPSRGAPAGPASRRHGLLRGWARTDAQGRYRFDTIRPAGYPGTDIPEHIHLHVIEPGRCTYWIDDIHFRDDPRLTRARIRESENGRAGNGVAMPQRRAGVWHVSRDIELGRNIPGYEGCGKQKH